MCKEGKYSFLFEIIPEIAACLFAWILFVQDTSYIMLAKK